MKNLHIKCKNMDSRQNVIGILGNMGLTNVAGGSLSIQTMGKLFAVTGSGTETQDETLTCDEFISQYGNVSPLQSDLTYSGINASLDSENAELRNSVRILRDENERLLQLLEIANQNSLSWQGLSYKNNLVLTTLAYVVFGLIIGAVLAVMI